MSLRLPRVIVCGLLCALATPHLAEAFAEPGQKIDPVELPKVGGGKAPLVASSARVNVFLFFRADQDRSIEAIRQLAACEKELGGKGVRFVLIAPGSTSAADVRSALASAGATLPVLVDEGDKAYDALGVRMHPVVGLADGKGVILAMEPYRQLDFGDVLRARVRFALGEIDRKALDAAIDPAAAPMPGGDPVKKAMRDVKMARQLIEFGQFEAAVKQAQKALEQAPVPEAFPVLGLAYAKMGRCADARRMLEQAQTRVPDSKDIPPAKALCAGK
jgi:tetratricopeptide (TPR) repeat protein